MGGARVEVKEMGRRDEDGREEVQEGRASGREVQ